MCHRRKPSGSRGDDALMRTATRWVGAFGAVVCVAAAVVLCVAAFLPYTGGNWGDGLDAPTQVTVSIVSGSDAWFVLGTVVTLALVAASHLVGVHRRATGPVAFAASLVTLGLAVRLPATWQQGFVVPGEPYLLFTGFYVFLGGAVAAVAGGLLMTIRDSCNRTLKLRRSRCRPPHHQPQRGSKRAIREERAGESCQRGVGMSRGSLPACLGRNRHGRRGCGLRDPSGSCPLQLGNRHPE